MRTKQVNETIKYLVHNGENLLIVEDLLTGNETYCYGFRQACQALDESKLEAVSISTIRRFDNFNYGETTIHKEEDGKIVIGGNLTRA